MERVILYTKSKNMTIGNIKKVEELPDEISDHIIIIDIDSVGFTALPDIIDENILIAITSNMLPGYTMKLFSMGFYEVITTPFEEEEVYEAVKKAKKTLEESKRIIFLSKRDLPKGDLCEELCSIVGNPNNMSEVIKLAGKAASVDVPVLITGESGTGKELFAKAIWKLSKRWQGPFIAINCSSIPENLFEAELFGYEKGAFTGAVNQKKGLIEEANHGILFLDELGDMPLQIQTKLLRVLQEKKIRRLGGKEEIPVNIRVIGATNRNLEQLVQEGKFREDLFYRLNVIHIHLPPLRERRDDIPVLVDCLIKRFSKEYGKRIVGYTKDFIETIINYDWPGNIRELENVIKRAIALSTKNVLTSKDIPELTNIKHTKYKEKGWKDLLREDIKRLFKEKKENVYSEILNEVEKLLIEEAISKTGNNQVRASKLLGINRLTLRKKLKLVNQN